MIDWTVSQEMTTASVPAPPFLAKEQQQLLLLLLLRLQKDKN